MAEIMLQSPRESPRELAKQAAEEDRATSRTPLREPQQDTTNSTVTNSQHTSWIKATFEDGSIKAVRVSVKEFTDKNRVLMTEIGSAGICLCDFFLDIMSARSLSHGHYAHKLGYIAGGCLCATLPVNFWLVRRQRNAYPELFKAVKKELPLVFGILQMLAMTNSEVLLVALKLSEDKLKPERRLEASIVGRKIKQYALISQVTEDVPQLTIQLIGLQIQRRIGRVSPWVIISISMSLGMLLFKLVGNMLLWVIDVKASESTVAYFARKHELKVRWSHLDRSDVLVMIVRVVMLFINLTFMVALGQEHHPLYRHPLPFKLPYLGTNSSYIAANEGGPGGFNICISYQGLCFSIFLFTYVLSLFSGFAFVRRNRDLMWHAVLQTSVFAFIMICATFYPPAVLAISPRLRDSVVDSCCFPSIPALRYFLMAGLGGYCVWKTTFAVNENLCIAVTILNTLCLAQFFFNMDDVKDREMDSYQQVEPEGNNRDLQRIDAVETGSVISNITDQTGNFLLDIPTIEEIDEHDKFLTTGCVETLEKRCLSGEPIATVEFEDLLTRSEELVGHTDIYGKCHALFQCRRRLQQKLLGSDLGSFPLVELIYMLKELRETSTPANERIEYEEKMVQRCDGEKLPLSVLRDVLDCTKQNNFAAATVETVVQLEERYQSIKNEVSSAESATELEELEHIKETLSSLKAADDDMAALNSKITELKEAERKRKLAEEKERRRIEKEEADRRKAEEEKQERERAAEEKKKAEAAEQKKKAEEERKKKAAEEVKKKAAAADKAKADAAAKAKAKAKAKADPKKSQSPEKEPESPTAEGNNNLKDLMKTAHSKRGSGDFSGAIADYDAYLALAPTNVEALRGRGAAKMGLGDFGSIQAAKLDLELAVRMGDKDALTLCNQCDERIQAAFQILNKSK